MGSLCPAVATRLLAAMLASACAGAEPTNPPEESATPAASSAKTVHAPTLLLDRRPPREPKERDPIADFMEPLPAAIACATPVARGRRMRRTVPRVAALYDACWVRLAESAATLSPAAARSDAGLRACLRLAKVLTAGEACTPDAVLADGIAARACARGLLPACAALAGARFVGVGAAADPQCAEHVLADTCERGDMDACGELAMKRAGGYEVPRDTATARELGARACAGGSYRGCVAMEELRVRPEEYRAAAVNVARRACDSGDGDACEELAKASRYRRAGELLDVPFDKEESKRLMALACASGNDHACVEGASDLAHEELASRCAGGEYELCVGLKTQTRAPLGPLLDAACRAGIGRACPFSGPGVADACAARVTEACRPNHRFVPEDATPEQSLLACDNGSGIDCSRLGKDAAQLGDESAALGFYDKGCPPLLSRPDSREVDPAACRELGRGLRRLGDAAAAAPLFGKACFLTPYLSDGEGCLELASMYERGDGVERNIERAFDIYVGTCGRAYWLHESERACDLLQERRKKHLDLLP